MDVFEDAGALNFLRRSLASPETAAAEEGLMEDTYFFRAASSGDAEVEGFFLVAVAADDDGGPKEERLFWAAEVLKRLKESVAAERKRETRFWAVEAGIGHLRVCVGRERFLVSLSFSDSLIHSQVGEGTIC